MPSERRIARVTYFVEPTPRFALGVDAFMSPATAIDVAWEFTDDADRQLGLDGALTRYVKANKNCMSPRKSKPISDAARAEFYRKSAGSSAYEVWTRVSTSGVRFSVLVEFDETSEIRRVLSDPFLDRFEAFADLDLSGLSATAEAPTPRGAKVSQCDPPPLLTPAAIDEAALLKDLKSKDPNTRRNAIIALSGAAHAAHRSRFLTCLNDQDEFVRVAAARALGRVGEPSAIGPLETARVSASGDLRCHFDEAILEIRERHLPREERERRERDAEEARKERIRRVEEAARRQAEADRALVERAYAEHERQRELEKQIQRERAKRGECERCGQPLHAIARLLGRQTHRHCFYVSQAHCEALRTHQFVKGVCRRCGRSSESVKACGYVCTNSSNR